MSVLKDLFPVNARAKQSVSDLSEPASGSPPRKSNINPDYSISNLTMNTSLNSTFTSTSSIKERKEREARDFIRAVGKAEASIKQAAQVLDDLEDSSTQNSLQRAVDSLCRSADTTISGENEAENSKLMLTLIARIGPADCLPIMLGMQEKITASVRSYSQYLSALEQLLEACCSPEDDGGLSEQEILTIYSHLEKTLENVRIVRYQQKYVDKAVVLLNDLIENSREELSLDDTVKQFHSKEALWGMPVVIPGERTKIAMNKNMRGRVERWQDCLKSRNIQRPEFPQQTKDDEMDDSEDGNNSSGNIPDDESLASDGQTEQSIVV